MSEQQNAVTTILISGLLGTALGIIATYSTGVTDNRTEIVRLVTQVQNLTITINKALVDVYTTADADKDHAVIKEKIQEIQANDRELERKFNAHINRGIESG